MELFNIMKDLIRTVFLTMAIYWGAIAANSDDVNILATVVFSVSSSGFVMTKDNNWNYEIRAIYNYQKNLWLKHFSDI